MKSLASANGKKITRLLVEQDRSKGADLYRTATAGPSGQRTDVLVGRVYYSWKGPFEVEIIATDGPFKGERSGYAYRDRGQWSIFDDRESEGIHFLGRATSLSLGVDVLRNGLHAATGRHDHARLSGGRFEPYQPKPLPTE